MCEWCVVCKCGAAAHYRRFSVWQHRSELLVIKNAALMPFLPHLHLQSLVMIMKHKKVMIEEEDEIVFNTIDSITCTFEIKLCKSIVLYTNWLSQADTVLPPKYP